MLFNLAFQITVATSVQAACEQSSTTSYSMMNEHQVLIETVQLAEMYHVSYNHSVFQMHKNNNKTACEQCYIYLRNAILCP